MLEEIRKKIMERIASMRLFTNTWSTDIAPIIQSKVDICKDRSVTCNIIFNGAHGFEVLEGLYQHTVNLNKQTCTCKAWNLKGCPCAHAICAMINRNLDPDAFISHWFRKEKYLKCYGTVMQPVTGIRLWPDNDYPTILPPEIRKKAGRPKINRRKDKDEPKKAKIGKMSKKVSR